MSESMLSYTIDKDYDISKRHLMHKYRAKLNDMADSIKYELDQLHSEVESDPKKMDALSDIKGSNFEDYKQYFEIADRSLQHFVESDLGKADLVDKFTHLWYKIGNKFRRYYNNFKEDRVLTDENKEGILNALATGSLDLVFLGDASKQFISESSINRKTKLQLAFTASTFSQMNQYIKGSPWETLKDFKESYLKPTINKYADKFLANQQDVEYEDALDKDVADLDKVDADKKSISKEDYDSIISNVQEEAYEEIIAIWEELVNRYFEHNEALVKLKTKFPKIAESTVSAKTYDYMTSVLDEKLAENKYYLNKQSK